MGCLVTVWQYREGGGMLVGMGELCNQVLLQSLPTVDWMLYLVLALEGGGLVGWWTPGVSASVGPETGIKSLQS